MWKKFRKITIRYRNFCKILKTFQLPTLEISFLIAYNSATVHHGPLKLYAFCTKNFGCVIFLPLLGCKTATPELLSILRKIKKYENFSIPVIHFIHLSSSKSLQRKVFTGSNLKTLCFKKLSSHQLLEHSSLIIYWSSLYPLGILL